MVRRKSPPRSKERAIEIWGENSVQECPRCGHWYCKSDAVPCHACAMGMTPY